MRTALPLLIALAIGASLGWGMSLVAGPAATPATVTVPGDTSESHPVRPLQPAATAPAGADATLLQEIDRLRAEVATLQARLTGPTHRASERFDSGRDAQAAEIARLRQQVAAMAATADPSTLTPDMIAKRLGDARNAYQQALADRDGDAAVAAVQAMIALGEAGYPEAIAAILELRANMNGENDMGLSRRSFYRHVGDRGLYEYAIHNPAVTAEFRELAAHGLPWTMPGHETAELFATLLPQETDTSVAAVLVHHLARNDTETAANALLGEYHRETDPGRRLELLAMLGRNDHELARQFVGELADTEQDASLRHAAEALSGRVPGLYITQVFPDTQAASLGLKPGDVMTTYGGQTLRSVRQLGNLKDEFENHGQIPAEVWRNGSTRVVQFSPGRLGIDCHSVGR